MAAKTTLNEKNLTSLGAERLAALVMELVTGDAALKRQARAALLEQAGGDALASEVRKRIATIKRSGSFVDWHKQRAFADDLDRQRAMIAEKIAPDNPATALELMWRFLELAGSVYERTDDSNGTVGDIFREACTDLGPLMEAAKPDPVKLAEQVFGAAVKANDYAQYDGLIGYAAPALGEAGFAHLKSLVLDGQNAIKESKPEPKSPDVIGWSSSGPIHRHSFERDSRSRAFRYALQEIADAQGDVDAFIAGYDAQTRTVPRIAAEIAVRFLRADRAKEAMDALEKAETSKGYVPGEWIQVRLATLEALGREAEAQDYRWQQFETTLGKNYLRAYLERLPDFEDIEAEERALDIVRNHENTSAALAFLVNWPSLDRAAALVLENRDDWDGDAYYLLTPAAGALEAEHPLAATILRREMITYSLGAAKSSRYKHAARHLLECESLAVGIDDFKGLQTHGEFVEALRRKHPRKTGFWTLLPS